MLKKLTQAYILFTLDYATPSTGIWNVLRPINISKKKKKEQARECEPETKKK